MRNQFPLLLLPMATALLLSACAGQSPRHSGDYRAAGPDPYDEFLAECERREQMNQPRTPDCPYESSEARLSQPSLGPVGNPMPSLPTLPGSRAR